MKRLLVVPFTYSEQFRLRSLEFATRWTRRYQVFVWRWHWLTEVRGGPAATFRFRQAWVAFRDLTRRLTVSQGKSGLHLVDAPFLQPALVRRAVGLERALGVARWFNARQLRRTVRDLEIDRVVLSSGWVDLLDLGGVPVFYDFVDWFNEDSISASFLNREMSRLRGVLSRTCGNFAVSVPLVKKLATQHGIASRYLPNGVDIRAMRDFQPTVVDDLRRRLSLQGKWVLGYVGNHDAHSGLDFLIEVFKALLERSPDVALMIVGPYDLWKQRLHIPVNAPIRFTGPLPAVEIPLYCHLQDLAVHPCEKSQFRDYALPLKVVEASAARKLVVSTDLLALREIALPNVWLLERSVDRWVETIQALRSARWQPEWDRAIELFDWDRLADTSAEWISEGKV